MTFRRRALHGDNLNRLLFECHFGFAALISNIKERGHMSKTDIIKPYKEEYTYSYASGAYGTYELLDARPEQVRKVLIHPSFARQAELQEQCRKAGIPTLISESAFLRINQKENSYVLGVFEKFSCELDGRKPHIVLVNPADMGNLGTIIRTMVGFNMTNLAIITPAADIYNPKTIRASMGALFRLEFERFASFQAYRERFPDHAYYPFMLDGKEPPDETAVRLDHPYALIFGNEATGLDPAFSGIGTAVKIPQSEWVDSLNVSIAFGIGAYIFAKKSGLI
jgi:RNA methyltransferase, TrmH family